MSACVAQPALLNLFHEAMSREIARDRDSLMSSHPPADARVANFLRYWVDSLAKRGIRTDQITLRMTRAEIGSLLGHDARNRQPRPVQTRAQPNHCLR